MYTCGLTVVIKRICYVMLCDRRTDRGTRDDSMYRASTASLGKNQASVCDTTRPDCSRQQVLFRDSSDMTRTA